MEILTLIIKEVHLMNILNGTKKIETREVRPNTAKKYCEFDTKTGDYIGPRHYDALQLYAGYNTNRKGALVMNKGAEVIVLTDEVTNEDIVYIENGQEYVETIVEYALGDIVSTQNC